MLKSTISRVFKFVKIGTAQNKIRLKYLDVRFDMHPLTLVYKFLYPGEHVPTEIGLIFRRPIVVDIITRSTGTAELVYLKDKKPSYRKLPLYIELWTSGIAYHQSANLTTVERALNSQPKL